jgi:hypothetical protein
MSPSVNLGPDFGVWNLTFPPKINIIVVGLRRVTSSLAAIRRVHLSETTSWELDAVEDS